MYLYLFHQYTFGVTHRCKVGVSSTPENRLFRYIQGGFAFYRKWPMPDRASAFALEAVVIRCFPAWDGRELLNVPAEAAARFIDAIHPGFCSERRAAQ